MYSKILVPLDGSQRAELILPYVEALAKNFNSKLILLNVIEPVHVLTSSAPVDWVEASVEAEEVEDAEIYLHRMETRFQELGIPVESFVMDGSPVKEIIRLAQEEDVDLIAIASHGFTGLARVFYGSVAVGLVHHTDRPLLIIRANELR
jgi:nucleotide-binding universal stress UspA family protein